VNARPEFLAACFDLDGTLIDTEPLHLKAERKMLREFGVEELRHDHPRLFGVGDGPGVSRLVDLYGLPSYHKALELQVGYWDELIATELALIPAAELALTMFEDAGVPMALVTSGDSEYVALVTQRIPIEAYFQIVVTADDVANIKPAPDPYLLAAEHFGIPPERVTAFEDSGFGVASAMAAGTHCVAVHSDIDSRPELHLADVCVMSLDDITVTKIGAGFALETAKSATVSGA